MNRSLVTTGVALVVAGVLLFFYVMFAASSRVEDAGAPLTATQDPVLLSDVSRLWGVVAGLAFAAGLALVGIGMNRWRQRA